MYYLVCSLIIFSLIGFCIYCYKFERRISKMSMAPEGIYLMQIVDVQLNREKQYLRLFLDWNDPESEWYQHGKQLEEQFEHRYGYVQVIMSYKERQQKSFWWKVCNILNENKLKPEEVLPKVKETNYEDLVGLQCYWNLKKEPYTNSKGEQWEKFTNFPDLILKKDLKKAMKKQEIKAVEPSETNESNPFDTGSMPF